MTRTVQEMTDYTNQEWRNLDYFTNMVAMLKENKIKSMADIGACFGEVSKLMVEKIETLKKVVAVEAIPTNFSILQQNLQSLVGYQVVLVNKAIFYGKDYVDMGTSLGNMGGYGIHSDGIINNHENVNSNIPTTTLENVIPVGVDFLKMDVEGAEKNIIENSSVLRSIRFLEIEFHDELSEPNLHIPFLEKYLPDHKVISTFYRYGGGNNVFLSKW